MHESDFEDDFQPSGSRQQSEQPQGRKEEQGAVEEPMEVDEEAGKGKKAKAQPAQPGKGKGELLLHVFMVAGSASGGFVKLGLCGMRRVLCVLHKRCVAARGSGLASW